MPKIKDGYNPATWMLEVSSAKEEANLGVDFAEIYKNSDLHKRNKDLIKELSVPPPGSKDLHFNSQYSQPFITQCKACLWKQHLSYWRNPPYTAVRFLFTTVIAVMFGSIFWQLGSKRYVIIRQALRIFSVMFSLINQCNAIYKNCTAEQNNKIFLMPWVPCMALFFSSEYRMQRQFSQSWPLRGQSSIEKGQLECTLHCPMPLDRFVVDLASCHLAVPVPVLNGYGWTNFD